MKAKGINGNGAGVPLAIRAQESWPTSTAKDADSSGRHTTDGSSHPGTTLTDAMPGRHGGESLPNLLMRWPTPTAHDGRRPGADLFSTEGMNLSRDAALWMPPSGPNFPRVCSGERSSGANRTELVNAYLSGLPAPTTPPDGARSSSERRTLNPLFVEWLMGWPPHWTEA